jgi:hypothetical protein
MIVAGSKGDVKWGDGNWIFFDVGFSNNGKTCGLVFGDGNPECFHYGDAKRRIVEYLGKSKVPTKLVIEAPLSICFDERGNPKGRKIEREGSETRYWHVGPGCSVMVAAGYLVREMHDAELKAPVHLFEGFVTFKSEKTTHPEDVNRLRNAVRNQLSSSAIYSPEELVTHPGDRLVSAFREASGIPAVIKA